MKINILERNLVEKPFNCFSLPLKPMRSAWGVKCHRYMYVTSVFYGCIISWLHIVCTPLIPLSFISSMCSLYVPFAITESQQDDNCLKHLTTDVNTNTCIIIAKIIMKYKLQMK